MQYVQASTNVTIKPLLDSWLLDKFGHLNRGSPENNVGHGLDFKLT